ncbi:MAG TPA: ParB/RepB/Spo0J family partition protein [Clostridia bacterium]|nr:ParB/RepB/Spo0J family partition protein [Clostridia bacterium]
MAKRGLGKGLSALIPELEDVVGSEVIEVELDRIRPNRFQARQDFDEGKLEELAASIREHGVVQPVILRRLPDEACYELVAGERRWRACKMAGLRTVPAVVKELDDEKLLEIGLIENLQREDLNAMEEAFAYHQLINHFGFTQEQLAERLGKSRPQIANTLRLLQLDPSVQRMVREGQLSFGHARALLGVEDRGRQVVLAKKVVEDGLNVRQVERLVAREMSRGDGKKEGGKKGFDGRERDPAFEDVERQLREYLGCPVRISGGRQKGKIELNYYGLEDLERIVGVILGRGTLGSEASNAG